MDFKELFICVKGINHFPVKDCKTLASPPPDTFLKHAHWYQVQ